MEPPSGRSRFRISWVLVDELALGPAPLAERHLDRLEAEGVRAVLSLCSTAEAHPPPGLERRFRCARLVLPDHRSGRPPSLAQLQEACSTLAELRAYGPVYVHCVAAMERSPLLCLAWLVRQHGQPLQRALDYLQQLHPGTNPLPEQLHVLRRLVSD